MSCVTDPTSRPGSARPQVLASGIVRLIAIMLLGSGVLTGNCRTAIAAPPGGPFALTDGDGRQVSDRDFRGRYMLIYFGFTFCPEACPTTLSAVADALDRLGAKADRIQPIFITLDPKRDTPAVMKQYAAAFDRRLIGLTGTTEQIDQVAEEYRVYHVENRTGPAPGDYSIDHSSVLYVMGPDGRFIVGIRGDASGAEIVETLAELMS